MKKVFLDANIVIAVGKPPYGPEFARVIDLVETEQIKILTTDLTMAEVKRNYVKRDFEEIKCICKSQFRKMVKDSVNTQVPTISEEELWNVLKKKYSRLVKERFGKMGAKSLRVSEVETNKVFLEYFNERGLFADGSGKKHQFPDAFVFERLKDEASQNEPIIIVSKDRDFERPVNDQKHISLVKSLPDLFNSLGLKLEDPEIDHFLEQNFDVLIRLVNNELSNWSLEGDIENSEITETEVTGIDFHDTIAFESAEKGGAILVVGRFFVLTNVDFTHPDESISMYDSDVRGHIYYETVHNQNEIELQIDVSLSIAVDDKGDPVEIEELEFRNDNFVYVELDTHEHYWYEL